MKKLQTKHSTDQCAAFENFMVEIGQWKKHNGSIIQVGNFKTQDEIQQLWKDRLAKIAEAEKQKAKTKTKTIYRKNSK